MTYSKWNTYLGWGIFGIASLVYLLSIEDTVSLWDCGEYITAAYKLEVGHPPGAPLFMLLGRLFSFFVAPENVAVWINSLSAISSSLTILFMFWSLTLLLKKLVLKHKSSLSSGDQIAVFSAAAIGALSYTFSDSFWFSAVEGEVYAMASLFTAIVFWAALKWDEEMMENKLGLGEHLSPNRWLLLIMFLLGLAIGVHLLCILVIPAICYIVYFRVNDQISPKGIILTGIVSIFTLGFIQVGVIPGTISAASFFEVYFVNGFGAPFFTGTIFFFAVLVAGSILLVLYARRSGRPILYNAIMGLVVLLIGYGSFAVIVIRSNANTPLDENNPENLVTLRSYLNREQYGSVPVLKGQYWNSLRKGEVMNENGRYEFVSRDGWGDLSPNYIQRYVVQEDGVDIKGFEKEEDAIKYVSKNEGFYEITEKYFESNAAMRIGATPAYSQETFFPRMHSEGNPQHQRGYENWSGYDANEDKGTDLGRDGSRLPTFSENLTFFFRYQVNWMYFRYFMWNFAGRQNDIQGSGDNLRGNWLSGINIIDDLRLGSQEFSPRYTTNNPSHNRFFLLPLILAIIGLFFHFYRAPKDAFVLFLAFLFTGIAILIYLNQKPFEPRERDYAYAGSFYFFAMWIGIGVYALYDVIMRFKKEDFKPALYIAGGGLMLTLVLDLSLDSSFVNSLIWLFICLTGGLIMGGLVALRKTLSSEKSAAIAATIVGLFVPIIMGFQGWDDHNRNGKTSAHDLAYNYLMSCEKNGIIFTNGDNDTFPLWYMQEVEGIRTDVRVCNLSLMGTDWYTNQMKMKAYESEPLPIKFREDQILMYSGNTDQIYFIPLIFLYQNNASNAIIEKVIGMRLKNNPSESIQAVMLFNSIVGRSLSSISIIKPEYNAEFSLIKTALISSDTNNLLKNINQKYTAAFELLKALKSGKISIPENVASEFEKLLQDFEKPWASCDLSDAMAFVRDDSNFIVEQTGGKTSFFPSSSFTLKVNKKNVVASGVVKQSELKNCLDKIEFQFNPEKDQYLNRDEIMMMDIVANNDWKRGIYFSSSRGSSFSVALLSSGFVKQVGLAYELSPIRTEPTFYNMDKMYNNLIKTYHYGEMAKPGVLTDYYSRRHTIQYRVNFLLLAEQFFEKGNKKRAVELLDFSLAKMPQENVLDFSEIGGFDPMSSLKINQTHQTFLLDGQQMRPMCSGTLHEYVQLYYLAGETKKAEVLGLKLVDNYDRIFNYYLNTNVKIGAKPDNVEDLFAALDACFKMKSVLPVQDNNKKGSLAIRINKSLSLVYKSLLPKMMNELEQLASDNGESVEYGDGRYSAYYTNLLMNSSAIGQHYKYIPTPKEEVPVKTPEAIDLKTKNNLPLGPQ